MTNRVYTFKTINGDTLLGELHSVDTKSITYNVVFPIKILLSPTLTRMGLITQYIPTLYQPFGVTKVIPFKEEFFISVLPCTESDARYYMKTLEMLLNAETERLLYTDAFFNSKDYEDVIIMKAPEILQ